MPPQPTSGQARRPGKAARQGGQARQPGKAILKHGALLGASQAGLSKLSYEESKFLGGDVAHTHLVKGLDFALLQKVRAGPGCLVMLLAALSPALFASLCCSQEQCVLQLLRCAGMAQGLCGCGLRARTSGSAPHLVHASCVHSCVHKEALLVLLPMEGHTPT